MALGNTPGVLAGSLKKKCPTFPIFQQRYVVLRDARLEWYGSAEEYQQLQVGDLARGFISFAATECVVQVEGETRFSVAPAAGVWTEASPTSRRFSGGNTRVLHFDASGSEFSRVEWLDALRRHIFAARTLRKRHSPAMLLATSGQGVVVLQTASQPATPDSVSRERSMGAKSTQGSDSTVVLDSPEASRSVQAQDTAFGRNCGMPAEKIDSQRASFNFPSGLEPLPSLHRQRKVGKNTTSRDGSRFGSFASACSVSQSSQCGSFISISEPEVHGNFTVDDSLEYCDALDEDTYSVALEFAHAMALYGYIPDYEWQEKLNSQGAFGAGFLDNDVDSLESLIINKGPAASNQPLDVIQEEPSSFDGPRLHVFRGDIASAFDRIPHRSDACNLRVTRLSDLMHDCVELFDDPDFLPAGCHVSPGALFTALFCDGGALGLRGFTNLRQAIELQNPGWTDPRPLEAARWSAFAACQCHVDLPIVGRVPYYEVYRFASCKTSGGTTILGIQCTGVVRSDQFGDFRSEVLLTFSQSDGERRVMMRAICMDGFNKEALDAYRSTLSRWRAAAREHLRCNFFVSLNR